MAIHKNRFEAGNEAAWKELREKLIAEGRLGGSMVGIAAKVSGYKSAMRLWAELKGLIEVEDISGRESVRNGKDHEGYVAARFAELSGKEVHRENCIFTNDEYPHLFASIDRKISNEESGLECKTANAFMFDKFTDAEFPKTYYAQVCSYLAVTGFKRWYLCVWCMGLFVKAYLLTTEREDLANKPEWITGIFFVSPEELKACETIAANFVESLKADECPYIDGSDDETEVLKELYPKSNGLTRNLGNEVDLLIQERASLEAEIDEKEERISVIENTIRTKLGKNELGMTEHYKVSYKTSTTKRVNNDCIKAANDGVIPEKYYKVSEGRTLRITKAKAKKA
jgi:putative phage-type endonuclease